MRSPRALWSDLWFEARSAYQRVRYGYAYRDAWNFYQACAGWSLPRLRHLRANLHGHPVDLDEREWDRVLDEIIFAIEECATGAEEDRIYERFPSPPFRFVDCGGYSKLEHLAEDTHRDARDASRAALDARVAAGLRLFGERFQNLWD